MENGENQVFADDQVQEMVAVIRDYLKRNEKKHETNEVVSVIIPTYNVEAYLRQCLETVIHQIFTPLGNYPGQ